MNLSFKICALKDLDTLMKISRETFIVAFEKDNNPDDFLNYINDTFNVENIKSELLNSNSTFYFAYLDEVLVGYFKINIGEAQNEQFDESSIELERIYVLEDFQGQKVGEHMLIKATDIATLKEVDFLWLGVWQENVHAVRFYEKLGFKIFDKHPYYIGTDRQMDWLMKYYLI